ncbi:MAG: glycine zipper 2TM domain-containing protein [Tsuneonella suprasediminis]|nr:glycine zipper 2TM domain-containing protein [Altererythrobacter sp. N1]
MKKTLLVIAAAGLTIPMATPAAADPPSWAPAHGYREKQRDRYERREARRYYRTDNGIRYWRGDDGRYYCKRSNGTTGLIVGAAVGALAGRAVDTRGDRTTGTVVGAAVGALLGKEIDSGKARCR